MSINCTLVGHRKKEKKKKKKRKNLTFFLARSNVRVFYLKPFVKTVGRRHYCSPGSCCFCCDTSYSVMYSIRRLLKKTSASIQSTNLLSNVLLSPIATCQFEHRPLQEQLQVCTKRDSYRCIFQLLLQVKP